MHTLSYPKHFLFYIAVVKGKTLVEVENVWVKKELLRIIEAFV